MGGPGIVVVGAGAVGAFAGGLLAAAGRDVVLLGRARHVAELGGGVTCRDYAGREWRATPEVSDDPGVLAAADIVLVAVKSGATAEVARMLADRAPERAVVVSLQNGMRNVAVLRAALPGRDVRAGMVGFNVVAEGAVFSRTTSGGVAIGAGPGDIAAVLGVLGLDLSEVGDIEAVQWGKLLLNLTNAVNALSGLSLRDMLLERGWRRVMAAQMAEALAAFRAAGIAVRVPAKAPAWAIPHILRLPTWAFRRVAAPMLVVDPKARTSMVADLEAGRVTEVEEFQGEVLRLGARAGLSLPVNAAVLEAVRRAEAEGLRPVSPGALLRHEGEDGW